MHDNFLKPYMDKEKIWRYGIVKFLHEKLKKLNAMEPPRNFGLDYIYNYHFYLQLSFLGDSTSHCFEMIMFIM